MNVLFEKNYRDISSMLERWELFIGSNFFFIRGKKKEYSLFTDKGGIEIPKAIIYPMNCL